MRSRFSPTAALAVAAALVALAIPLSPPPAVAQTSAGCEDSSEPTPEIHGPTDINATSGNQRLSIGVNEEGTVSVFKWPSPSFYDQIKYQTSDRRLAHMGALPNEGAMVGIAYKPDPRRKEGDPPWGFAWLRRWHSTQRFASDDSDEIITEFRKRRIGLRVKVRDLASSTHDVLYRKVAVKRFRDSEIRKVRVVAFSNFNPVFSKTRQQPFNDWCNEGDEDSGGTYLPDGDLVVQERSGTDASTGAGSSIAVGLGFKGGSDRHHVGADTYEVTRLGTSAYDDAADGQLSGADSETGQVDAALYDQFSLGRDRKGATVVLMGAAANQDDLVKTFRKARRRSYGEVRRSKATWWRAWLRDADLPHDAPGAVERLARRSLIVLRQGIDEEHDLVVASLATQSPLGLDWVRWGAYVNEALFSAGHPETVEAHNRRYAALQARAGSQPPGGETTPLGNWSENFYADGVVGGPKTHELDSTGLGIWTLWDYYRRTRDGIYLNSSVYEAIQRAAHYLSDDPPLGCRDPNTGLTCNAPDENSTTGRQSLVGAQAAWLGLDAAARAARARGGEIPLQNAVKWETRRDELAAAINQTYLDEEGCACFTTDPAVGGTFLWPVGFVGYRSNTANAQAAKNWAQVRRSLKGKNDRGGFESRALLGNAYVWESDPQKRRRLRKGLKWVARVPTTRTGLLGAAWMLFPPDEDTITTMLSQPHIPSHVMFYLATLRTYGSKTFSPRR